MSLPTKPTERVLDPSAQCVCLYGAPGVGKSTLLANMFEPGAVVFLDTEAGLKHLETYRIPVATFGEFEDAIRSLYSDDHGFRVVVVDTVDNVIDMAIRAVCEKLGIEDPADRGGGQRVWGLINRRLGHALKLLASGRFGVFFVSHEKAVSVAEDGHVVRPEERYKGPVKLRVMPSIGGKAAQLITGLSDIVIRAAFRGDRRVIETQPSETRLCKDRTGILPPVLDLDPEAYLGFFRAEYRRRKEQTKPADATAAPPQLVGGSA